MIPTTLNELSSPSNLSSLFLAVLVAAFLGLLWRGRRSRPSIFDECKTLYEAVMTLSDDVQCYSQPAELRDLPFPSLYRSAQTDRFNFLPHYRFSYIGREKFPEIVVQIERMLSSEAQARKLNIYGTGGYGKSHILAALACYLTRRGHAVVYIPDSELLVEDFTDIMQFAFLSACSHPSLRHHWPKIMEIESTDDLLRFSRRMNKELVFIIDQLNTFDPETGEINQEERRQVVTSLKKLTRTNRRHIVVESASANSRSYGRIQCRRLERTIYLFGGMSAAEMSAWWRIHEGQGQLPDFSPPPDDSSSPDSSPSSNASSPNSSTAPISAETSAAILRSQIEYMTGRIPLLLTPLFNFRDKHFEDIAREYWSQPTLRHVQKAINDFVHDRQNLVDFHRVMSIFLRGDIFLGNQDSLVDRRYLYQDGHDRTHIVCGIAREALAAAVRRRPARVTQDQKWVIALIEQRGNPTVLGFLVEQACISCIAYQGLPITLDLRIPETSVISFENDTVPLSQTGFYVPIKPNCMAIDCVYALVDERKNTAKIVPIQITIAKKHSDPEAKFFQNWNEWTEGLTGFDIEVTFVWIKEEARRVESLGLSTRRLRGMDVVVNPAYTRLHIPLVEVNNVIGEGVRKLRDMGVSFDVV